MEQSSCRRDRRQDHQGSSGEPFRHPSLPQALLAFRRAWSPLPVDRKFRQGELSKFRPLTLQAMSQHRARSAMCHPAVLPERQ